MLMKDIQQFWTLLYMERPTDSDALAALIGPSIHNSLESATTELFNYVKGRIKVGGKEEFIEAINEGNISPGNINNDLEDTMASIDIDSNNEEFETALDSVPFHQMSLVINWYFNLMADSTHECWYQIEPHQLSTTNR